MQDQSPDQTQDQLQVPIDDGFGVCRRRKQSSDQTETKIPQQVVVLEQPRFHVLLKDTEAGI